MRKVAFVIAGVLVLGGCTTMQKLDHNAGVYVCANKAGLIASAIALDDTAAIDAINAYCPPFPPSATASPAVAPTGTSSGVPG